MGIELKPCPLCGHDTPYFERRGNRRQSCIVACGNCGCRHESSDEGRRCGSSWNERAEPAQQDAPTDAPAWAPETIYLIDTGDGINWCEDPNPAPDMREEDAVKYVRYTPAQDAERERDALWSAINNAIRKADAGEYGADASQLVLDLLEDAARAQRAQRRQP